MSEGLEVTLDPKRLHAPTTCVVCNGEPDTRLLVPGLLGRVDSTSVAVCAECRMRGSRARRRWLSLILPVIVATGATLAVGLVARVDAGSIAAIGGVLGGAVAGATLWALGRLKGQIGRSWPPVRMLRARGSTLVLFASNAEWGEELARRSGGESKVARRPVDRWLGAAVVGGSVLCGVASAWIAWELVHSRVHVDNGFPTPLAIWIDGEREVVVEANGNATLAVRPGSRLLGYSAPADPVPTATTRVVVSDARYLYNPGRRACHFRVETVYSRKPGKGGSVVTLARREFQPVLGVHDWFEESPASVELRDYEQRKTRVAILRDRMCTRLVARGCPDGRIQQLFQCLIASQSDSAAAECERAAFVECPERAAGAATR